MPRSLDFGSKKFKLSYILCNRLARCSQIAEREALFLDKSIVKFAKIC